MRKVSYLVPCYNHDSYVKESLDSILFDACTLNGEFEILIVDDGSNDGTKEIITEWIKIKKTPNIKFVSRENKGLSETLNELISDATGEYIRLCSSDDIIMEGSTNLMLSALSNGLYDVVITDARIINSCGKVTSDSSISYHKGIKKALLNSNNIHKELISNWCVAGPASLIKKDLYDDFRYNSELVIDDFYLYLYMICNNKNIVYIDVSSCFYRIHDSNTSKTRDVELRIKNLTSFLTSCSYFSASDFSCLPELKILMAETKLKISYLNKDLLGMVVNGVIYIWRRLCYFF